MQKKIILGTLLLGVLLGLISTPVYSQADDSETEEPSSMQSGESDSPDSSEDFEEDSESLPYESGDSD
jgi:hypothetical protein